jgi:CxxC-x17-CxxC domain-containing protein
MGNFNRDRNSRVGRFSSNNRGDRQMFKTVCSNCGKDCQVPFKPTGDKPVYCSECFEKIGGRSERKSSDRSRLRGDSGFNDINIKLDRILSLLEPKEPKPKKSSKKVVSEEKV